MKLTTGVTLLLISAVDNEIHIYIYIYIYIYFHVAGVDYEIN